jgi:phosphate transport system protein
MAGMKQSGLKATDSTEEFSLLIRQACLVAKDSAFNVREFVRDSSKMAFLAVKDCEKELDRIERDVDEKITNAITQVGETQARELLACLKFIIDLERIGDLLWSVVKRLHEIRSPVSRDDTSDLLEMSSVLEQMLERIHRGFIKRDLQNAHWVLRTDTRIDQACAAVFRRHLESGNRRHREHSTNLLFVAQAFERAGDHAKNLSEELVHLVEGRSVRHELKRRPAQT